MKRLVVPIALAVFVLAVAVAVSLYARSPLVEYVGSPSGARVASSSSASALFVLTEVLLHTPAGTITADLNGCAHAELFEPDDACAAHGVLIAESAEGESVKQGTPYGIGPVEPAPFASAYYVYAANRENDQPKDFDAVYLVRFQPSLSITPIFEGWGFGGYDPESENWLIVEYQNDLENADLELQVLNAEGSEVRRMRIGAAIVQSPGYTPDQWLIASRIESDGHVVLGFFKEGMTQSKEGPFAGYRINPETGAVEGLDTF